jgi:adenylate kinase
MRVVVTGQVGLDKGAYLEQVAQLCRGEGCAVDVFHIGRMMYAEAPDVAQGKILDLPLSRLNNLRRSVFKDVLSKCSPTRSAIINTHATFRWRHGLFPAFDYDQIEALNADLYVTLVDNVDRVHWRLVRDGHTDHSLKDLMVWREEEILATEVLAQIARGHGCFCIASRGFDESAALAMARMISRPTMRKAYLSFPMTHLAGACAGEIETFRREMKRHFICFDPGDLEEKHLCNLAIAAMEQGRRTVESGPPWERVSMDTAQLADIIPDIDGQIYARDFKLIDQSDMIVSYVPAVGDSPVISSGVERELQHAHEATKDVFVIWRCRSAPSPFVTETATRVFSNISEALEHFSAKGYTCGAKGGLFA